MDKNKYRIKAKELLFNISEDEVLQLSLEIAKSLSAIISKLNPSHDSVIGGYAPIQKEAHWFESSFFEKMNLSVPHVCGDKEMDFYSVSLDELKSGELKISLDDKFKIQKVEPSILIIPGLGFDKNLNRLGRGGGFYDCYLKNFKGIKIGVGFEGQVFDSIPTEEHDRELDYLITEKNTYIRGNK